MMDIVVHIIQAQMKCWGEGMTAEALPQLYLEAIPSGCSIWPGKLKLCFTGMSGGVRLGVSWDN